MQQAELRRQLIAIQNNPVLDTYQKSKYAQSLFFSSSSRSPTNSNTFSCSSQPVYCTEINQRRSGDNLSLSCEHYRKSCARFQFSCCGVIDPCHRCHLARNTCNVRPPQVSSITCTTCQTSQEPSAACKQCGTRFANSYCATCKIWTDKEIAHCNDCGFCRVGRADSIFHCHTCDACFNIEVGKVHRCARAGLKDSVCVLCMESVHTSQTPSSILVCGHVLHTTCIKTSLQQGQFRCPVCRKCMVDMSSYWQQIKASIQLQPIPNNFFPIQLGEVVDSMYGEFVPTSYADGLYTGELVWGHTQPHVHTHTQTSSTDVPSHTHTHTPSQTPLPSHTHTRATLHESALRSKKHKVSVMCVDCGHQSLTNFHVLGLECMGCGGFNTSRV
ncbi:hypothetical protein EON63_11605 [archaeon]|nr:MAG: hypothetical protein EON63_11605 [archaeon]